jgi:hypothetical protein
MRTLAELVPLRTSACREAEGAIVMVAAGDGDVEPKAGEHVATCLRCQAEVAAYRRVMAVMRVMRSDELPLPGGGPAEALRSVHESPAGGGWVVRAAYVGGLTAAGAAGFLVWITLRRPGLPQAS